MACLCDGVPTPIYRTKLFRGAGARGWPRRFVYRTPAVPASSLAFIAGVLVAWPRDVLEQDAAPAAVLQRWLPTEVCDRCSRSPSAARCTGCSEGRCLQRPPVAFEAFVAPLMRVQKSGSRRNRIRYLLAPAARKDFAEETSAREEGENDAIVK
jgi:hypothetical protein